jgi:tetratricopeptide (TPR) repeat protein
MPKPNPPGHEERPKVTSLLDRLPPGRRARHLAMLAFQEHVKDPVALGRLGDWAAKLAGLDEDRVLEELARQSQTNEVVLVTVNYLAVRAAKRFLRGDAEGAFAEWASVVEAYPDRCAEAFELRGICRIARGELEEALDDFTRAIELAPLSARAYSLRGQVCFELGRVEEALANLRRALQIDPDSAEALRGMARCLAESGQTEVALRYYDRAIKRAPRRPDLLAERAECHEDLGRLDEALADLDAAIAQDRDDPELFRARGGCRDGAEAEADFSRAIELEPGEAEYWSLRALTRAELGKLDEALADAERAVELDPELPLAYMARACARQARGDLRGAALDHVEAGRREPSELVHVMNRAVIHQELGDLPALRADIDAAVVIDPTSVEVRALRGRLFVLEGALDRALEDFDAAFSLGEEEIPVAQQAELHHNTAEALSGLGRFEEAARHEALALERAPGDERYAGALARYRDKLGAPG